MASGTLLTEQDKKEFRDKYGELIRQQCVSLMGKTAAATELEERVIRSIEEKYEYQPLPEHCETMLIARCCILSSRMVSPDAEEEARAKAEAPAEAAQPEAPAPEEPSGKDGSKGPGDMEEAIPEELQHIKITAVIDPEKTALWLPDGMHADRVREQADPDDPDEAGDDRSVPHSVLNTLLVILFLGSIVFFLWKAGILHLLNRILEGMLLYG